MWFINITHKFIFNKIHPFLSQDLAELIWYHVRLLHLHHHRLYPLHLRLCHHVHLVLLHAWLLHVRLILLHWLHWLHWLHRLHRRYWLLCGCLAHCICRKLLLLSLGRLNDNPDTPDLAQKGRPTYILWVAPHSIAVGCHRHMIDVARAAVLAGVATAMST